MTRETGRYSVQDLCDHENAEKGFYHTSDET